MHKDDPVNYGITEVQYIKKAFEYDTPVEYVFNSISWKIPIILSPVWLRCLSQPLIPLAEFSLSAALNSSLSLQQESHRTL